jgi:Xaa-Pro aminopeptidase
MPGLAAVVDLDEKKDILFGNDIGLDDIIWMGPLPTLRDRAARVGVKTSFPSAKLADVLKEAEAKGRRIHFLPPYRPSTSSNTAPCSGLNRPRSTPASPPT